MKSELGYVIHWKIHPTEFQCVKNVNDLFKRESLMIRCSRPIIIQLILSQQVGHNR
jgi:hypothetical protein